MANTVDVKDEKAIQTFESMLQSNPITIVLIYADWCGHCQTFKKNIWSKLKSMSGRRLPLASVREDQFPKTSISSAKIKGYPTVIVVDKNKKIADFDDGTNALPNHNDLEKMKELVQKEPESILNSITPRPVEGSLTAEATALRVPEMKEDTLKEKRMFEGGGKELLGGNLIARLERLVNSRKSIFTRKRRGGGRKGQKLKRRMTRNRK